MNGKKLNEYQLAFKTMDSSKGIASCNMADTLGLHHVISCIYRAAIAHGQRLPIVSLDFQGDVVNVIGFSEEETCLIMIRTALLELTFYPYEWIVDFAYVFDDCGLQNVSWSD